MFYFTDKKIFNVYNNIIENCSKALDLIDKETQNRSERLTDLTLKIANKFTSNKRELINIRWGSLLYDIGKINIPNNILKNPKKLTDEEFEIIKKHTNYSYNLLSPIKYLKKALEIPYYHHERWDGSGYPLGLKQKQIPFSARVFAIADVWDALTNDRVYRKAWPKEMALSYIETLSGVKFDPEIVNKAMDILMTI